MRLFSKFQNALNDLHLLTDSLKTQMFVDVRVSSSKLNPLVNYRKTFVLSLSWLAENTF